MPIDPFFLDTGEQVLDFDDNTITVQGPTGAPVRIARQQAPQRFQQAVDEAQRADSFVDTGFDTQEPFEQPEQTAPEQAQFVQPFQAVAPPQPTPLGGGRPLLAQAGGPLQSVDPSVVTDATQPPLQSVQPTGPGTQIILEPATETQVRAAGLEPPKKPEPEEKKFGAPKDVGPTTGIQRPSVPTTTLPERQRKTQAGQVTEVEAPGLKEAQERRNAARRRIAEIDKELEQAKGKRQQQLIAERSKNQAEIDQINQQSFETQAGLRRLAKNEFELLQAQQEEILDAEIDPKNFWATKSTGEKVAAMIAVALGGLGQAFLAKAGRQPGRNAALDILNQAIDRDIDAQKANLGRGFKKLSLQKGDLAKWLQMGLSEQEAERMAKITGKQRVLGMLESKLAQETDPEKKLQAERAKLAIEADIERENSAVARDLASKKTAGTTTVTEPGGQTVSAIDQELIVPGIPGFGVAPAAARTKEEAKELRSQIAAADVLSKEIQRYRQLVQEASLGSLDDKKRLGGSIGRLIASVKDAEQLGAITAADAELIEGLLGPNPQSNLGFNLNSKAVALEIINTLEARSRDKVQANFAAKTIPF